MIDSVLQAAEFSLAPQEAPLVREEENQIKARLWTLLVKQAKLQTQGDHSSIREEDAAQLLQSMLFTLQCCLHRNGLPIRSLVSGNLNEMLKQGQHVLEHELNTAKTLYTIAVQSVDTFGSLSLRDTLEGIGQFFRLYDIRLFAHDIPVSIDYPLAFPIPENLKGVLYIREYLEWLLIENKLIKRFPVKAATALLERSSPDFRGLLCNLYAPVAANVIGLALLGLLGTGLEITASQAQEIRQIVDSLPAASAKKRLVLAAQDACRNLLIADSKSIVYISRVAETLYPRLMSSPQSAAGVFAVYNC